MLKQKHAIFGLVYASKQGVKAKDNILVIVETTMQNLSSSLEMSKASLTSSTVPPHARPCLKTLRRLIAPEQKRRF
jgi:predicted Na+-dependent transporter